MEASSGNVITGGADNASGLLLSAGLLSTSLFLISLAIFVALAIKSRTVSSFQSQIAVFVGVYVAGEVLELQVIQNATAMGSDLGSQIHVAATIIITLTLWSRLFSSTKSVKKLERENADQEGMPGKQDEGS